MDIRKYEEISKAKREGGVEKRGKTEWRTLEKTWGKVNEGEEERAKKEKGTGEYGLVRIRGGESIYERLHYTRLSLYEYYRRYATRIFTNFSPLLFELVRAFSSPFQVHIWIIFSRVTTNFNYCVFRSFWLFEPFRIKIIFRNLASRIPRRILLENRWQ